jgi:hypothetical protein
MSDDLQGTIADEPHHKVRRAPVNQKSRLFEGTKRSGSLIPRYP